MESVELDSLDLDPINTTQPDFQLDALPPQISRDPHSQSHDPKLNHQEALGTYGVVGGMPAKHLRT